MKRGNDFSSRYYIKLSQVREKFLDRLDAEVSTMRRDLEDSASIMDKPDIAALGRLYYKLHEITGSAGMLGLNSIHCSGRKTLRLVEQAVDRGRLLDDGEGEAVNAFLNELSCHAQKPMAG